MKVVIYIHIYLHGEGSRDSSVVRAPDSSVAGLSHSRSGGKIVYSRVNFLC